MVKTKRSLWVLTPILGHWGFGIGGGRMVANHVNNRFEEDLLIKVGSIEHPTVWQASVNWQRVLALCPAQRREDKEYFHIFFLAQCPDLIFQLFHVCPCICDCKDDAVVRHCFHCFQDSWEQKYIRSIAILYHITGRTPYGEEETTVRLNGKLLAATAALYVMMMVDFLFSCPQTAQ